MNRLLFVMIAFASATPEPQQPAPLVRIEVFPSDLQLTTARQTMHLVVTGYQKDGTAIDLTHLANFAVLDAKVAAVQDRVVVPLADGSTTVTVSVMGHKAVVPLKVANHKHAEPISFRNETVAVLTKHGCNAGSCHGSPAGKGGFSLSMMAYDPEMDLLSLVRSGMTRRINLLEPDRSLLLRKPTMQVAHGGGQRLRKTDNGYEVLRQWILEGCQADTATVPVCRKIEVFPPAGRVLRQPGGTQQVVVLGHFSDGSVRDVTALALFTTSHDKIANVTPDGLVSAGQRGITSINVRYLDEVVALPFTVIEEVPGFVWNNPPSNNYVDDLVHEQLKLLHFQPAPLCSDEHFVRRVYLDVTGQLPTVEETRSFLALKDPARRSKLIDQLLNSPAHARFWAQRTADLLRISPKRLTTAGALKYAQWIVDAVEKDMPFDQFVTALLTASGDTYENPPANYYRAAPDTSTVTETTAQLFLGVRIGCAKCHNHPFERWTQNNYYGIAAIFDKVQRTGNKDKKDKKDGPQAISMANESKLVHPRTGKPAQPWLPLSGEFTPAPGQDARVVFAQWLTGKDNPFFARVEVNRIWAYLLGHGIVDPVDDFRASNPPANARLLDALAADFVQSGFSRKHILRVILNSRAYQRSFETNAFNKADERHFSVAKVRLLSAEQLYDAVGRVTGITEKLPGVRDVTLATQLPVPLRHSFLSAFGQPPRETACQCERVNDPNMEQALQMLNGPTVQKKVQATGNRLHKLIAAKKTDAEIIGELYVAAFSRLPRDREMETALNYVTARPNRVEALEDVLWAILNTKEFLFQH